MATKILTAKAVEKMKGGLARREVPDGVVPGLYLIVQPSGRKSWAVRGRLHGKPLKYTLNAFELAKARTEAKAAIGMIREGKDPRTEAGQPLTFAELADQYVERWAKPRKRTWKGDRDMIDSELRPEWGKRRAAEIARRDVLALIEEKAKTAPIRANRLLALLKKLFTWAVNLDLLTVSPAADVKPPAKERSRDRILNDAELVAFWQATEAMGGVWGAYFQTLALTLQRKEEVAGMARPELHLSEGAALWTLSASRVKAGRVHDVPLVPAVVEIIEGVPEIVVDAKTETTSPRVFTMSGKPLSAFSAAKRRLDALMLVELRKAARERGENPDQVELAPWRLHDLRRTGASNLARMGFPPHLLAAVLNHSPGGTQGITAVYNRYRYGDEKRAALAAWARQCAGVGRAAAGKRGSSEGA
jgi:site-specific recombinase XerC